MVLILLSLDKGDIGSFIDAIKNYMDYDLVIYYLGIYTEASMEILRLSNGVYITICDTLESFWSKGGKGRWSLQGLI